MKALLLPLLLPLCVQAQAPASRPRPEHPNPQMVRSEWISLNGSWEFAETDDDGDLSFLGERAFPDRIIVPFCRESSLSGLGRKGFVRNVWYRSTFTVPKQWTSPRVRLHVGAADWRSRVWVNGRLLGSHVGGSTPFVFDVTDVLRPGPNRVVIHVFDDVRSGLQPLGKQSKRPGSYGCHYTRTTGIWQSVWLEGVGRSYLQGCRHQPDPEAGRLLLEAEVTGDCRDLTLEAVALWQGRVVGRATAPARRRGTLLVLPLAERHLWTPGRGGLYDLKYRLLRQGAVVDSVAGYFGLRRVDIQGRAILINGRAVFQRTVLDQGFYPDGIWTAPTDAALRKDIELSMAIGFNGARLHQKVFEPRFLWWADRMGYLVWGEYTNWGLDYKQQEINLPVISEWAAILRRDRNHPSIVGWCPFNETPKQARPLQARVVQLTRAIDPSRPVLETSGWSHGIADPEVLDKHDYNQDPVRFRRRWGGGVGIVEGLPARYGCGSGRQVPFFVSEYGGIGWFGEGDKAWGYGKEPRTLEEFYKRYAGLTNALLDNRLMFGFCYTQLTDVEQEKNGLYRFDRTPKFDVKRLAAINRRVAAYEQDPPLAVRTGSRSWRLLVGAAVDGKAAASWRYTLEKPAAGWEKGEFADGEWSRGRGGFGHKQGWEKGIHTPWKGKDIWLRTTFDASPQGLRRLCLVIHYDNATRVHLNGELIWAGKRWNDGYAGFDVTARALSLLKPGVNTLAVHCHQDDGGQFIDMALLAE